MKRKGQAALEFLTTYGWAFMVILVMIGALAYFGVLNPENLVSDQCIVEGGSCLDSRMTDSAVEIYLENNFGEPITVYDAKPAQLKQGSSGVSSTCDWYNGPNPTGAAYADTDIIKPSDKFYVYCTLDATNASFINGSKQKVSIEINYETEAFEHTAYGTLTATVK